MGFMRTINNSKNFLNKSINKISGFGGKVLHGTEKGLHIVGKIADVADKAADALQNVPVLGGLANEARTFTQGGKKLITMGENGLNKADNINKKFGKVRIK